MALTMRSTKRVMAASATALVCAAGSSHARSPCGDSYTIEYGDTLGKIAQACRVDLSALRRANPEVEARSLEPGSRLIVPRLETRSPALPDRAEGYEDDDAADDLFTGLAQDIGSLLAGIGEDDEDGAGRDLGDATVRPRAGEPGDWVTLRAGGFRPDEIVGVGVGRARSEFQVVDRVRADWRGDVETEVRVPTWANAGDDLVFVAASRGLKASSGRFDVTGDGAARPGQRILIEGRVEEGPECLFLETRDGGVYSLAGDAGGLAPGDYARVAGYAADMSYCQRGRTINVTDVRGARPDRGGERVALEGRVEDGVECPILRTRDGDVYSLAGGASRLTPGEYVSVRGVRAAYSMCMQGETISVRSVSEVSPPRNGGNEEGPARRTVTGKLIDTYRGCATLRTDDGDLWKLADFDTDRLYGDRVTVSGKAPRGAPCGRGATLIVDRIAAERRDTPQLGADALRGGWTVRGGDCRRPDFAITGNAAGGLVVETRLNGAQRTGYVREGADAAFIFDRPRRVFSLREIAPGRLSVSAPMNALNQEIAGRDIPRTGAVYDRCPRNL